jgi:hypothetical protein
MKCKLLREMQYIPDGWKGSGKLPSHPVGHEIDNPDAFKLVQMGCAVPADAECEEAHGMTLQQLQAAQHAYVRTELGIHPDDFAAYEAGVMIGYNDDGSYKPGPNYEEAEADDEEEGEANAS